MNSIHKKVPAFDLNLQIQQLRVELDAAINRVLSSNCFILGAEVTACEKEIADYVGTRYAVACASGTDALHLTLRAMGIQPGDEVITSAFTFTATAEAIAYIGATPVFADIDPVTFNLSSASVAAQITSKTTAIIAVHLFGHPAAMAELQEICQQNNLLLIEDCAQAFGARYHDQTIGGIATAGCHSFYPTKNLAACGDGGMITLNDQKLVERLHLLRNHGDSGNCHHQIIGYNSRLDELQAAILRVKLKHIRDFNGRRQQLANHYQQLLSSAKEITVPPTMPQCEHVYNQYTIRVQQRNIVQKQLTQQGVDSRIYYPRILPEQPAFSNHSGKARQSYPYAKSAAAECLSLPMFPEMSLDDVDYAAQALIYACKQ